MFRANCFQKNNYGSFTVTISIITILEFSAVDMNKLLFLGFKQYNIGLQLLSGTRAVGLYMFPSFTIKICILINGDLF